MKRSTILFTKIKSTLSIIAFAVLLNACTKEKFNTGETQEFTLHSETNGATYTIKVGLPSNYNPSGEKYHTIYLLDGKEIFGYVANRCKEIAEKNATQNVLVVSIGYGNDRSIDYTPTKLSSVTGGAPQFLKFIETQLIPKMEQTYHADTTRKSRVILGHSYGGLFGGYAFCTNNKVFGNYIILSPSFWFDNYISLQMEKDNRTTNKNKEHLVFMGIGENEETIRMLTPFNSFSQVLQTDYPNTKLMKNIEKNTAHMNSREPNIVKGLNFYFENR